MLCLTKGGGVDELRVEGVIFSFLVLVEDIFLRNELGAIKKGFITFNFRKYDLP